jgi:tetratricopeptide (TPR) repeat protein
MKRRVIASVALTALAVGVVLAWYTVRQEREFQRLIADGDAALARNETNGAIEAFSGALAFKPDSMLASLKRGDTYRRQGELAAALRDLRRAADLDPSAPQPLELLGDVKVAMGLFDEAAEHYLAFIRLDDRSERVLYKLGLAYHRGGQPERAMQPLRQALALDDRLAEAHYLVGLCLQETGSEGEAERALARAVEVNPTFSAAREALADLYDRTDRRRQSIEQLEALAALEPARVERLLDVGLAYARWGRTDAALVALGRVSERFPDAPGLRIALGRVWLAAAELREDDEAARRQARDLLQRDAAAPDASSDTLTLYGRALLLSGEFSRAESVLLEAAARLPVEPIAFRYLADAAQQLGHADQAADAMRRYRALATAGDAAVAGPP